jgi:hypothetical protein
MPFLMKPQQVLRVHLDQTIFPINENGDIVIVLHYTQQSFNIRGRDKLFVDFSQNNKLFSGHIKINYLLKK